MTLALPDEYVERWPDLRGVPVRVISTWAMGDRIGLWVRPVGVDTTRVYPIFDVSVEQLRAWEIPDV